MSVAPPLQTIAVGVVVERTKGVTPMERIRSGVRSACSPARRTTPPWTKLSDDGARATFFAGTAEIELYRTETTYYRSNLESGDARSVGRRCAPRTPSRLSPSRW